MVPRSRRVGFALLTLVASVGARARATPVSDAAKAMVGAWEISNATRDRTCAVSFALDAGAGGFKLELDAPCGTAFPSLKDIVAWVMGPNDAVRLLDSKGAIILDFSEVENGMYEAERKGEGLYFMRTQAAIRAATVSRCSANEPLLRDSSRSGSRSPMRPPAGRIQVIIKPACAATIANFGLVTWGLEGGELVLGGRADAWRFSESDATTWERIPPSTDPLVLMRQ